MAVKVPVALPGTLDQAASVGAAELFGPTGGVLCGRQGTQPVRKGSGWKAGGRGASLTALLRLVGAVATVVVVVAHEVFGDALSVLAHELVSATRVVEH